MRGYFSFSSFFLFSVAIAVHAPSPSRAASRSEVDSLIAQTTSEPGMFGIVNEWRFELTAPTRILTVWNRLKASPAALKIWNDSEKLALELARAEMLTHLKQAAQANEFQYSDWLMLTQEIAREKHIPDNVIEDAWVFIKQNPSANAYTVSGVPDRLLFMTLFTGILDLMSRGALKNVIGHEIGHSLGKHVLQHILLTTIFMTVGEDLIASDDPQRVPLRRQALSTVARSMTLCRACEASESTYQILEQGITRMVAHLKAHSAQSDLMLLIGDVQQALDLPRELRGIHTSKTPGATKAPGFKELQDFLDRLKDLGRQWETQADFEGLATAGVEDSMEADMRLAGGKGMTSQGAAAQLRNLRKFLADDPTTAAAVIDADSHPSAGERIEGYRQMVRTRQYKILTDGFAMAARYYMKASQMITTMEAGVFARNGEVAKLNQDGYVIDQLKRLASGLEQILVRDVTEEFESYWRMVEARGPIPSLSFERFVFLAQEFDATRLNRVLAQTSWAQDNETKQRVPKLLLAYFDQKIKDIEAKLKPPAGTLTASTPADEESTKRWRTAQKVFQAARNTVTAFSRGPDFLSSLPSFREVIGTASCGEILAELTDSSKP